MRKDTEKFIIENTDWSVEDGALVACFEFGSFEAVKPAVTKIMDLAEELNHHPEVTFGYKTVKIKTVTHEAGNTITEKDLELARAISILR